MKALTSSLLWSAFALGVAGTVSASRLFANGTHELLASILCVAVSLVAGTTLARREPLRSFLARASVMWFLFLFNLGAGVMVYLLVDGPKGLAAAIGLGVVGVGAGVGLALRGRARGDAGERTERIPVVHDSTHA